MKQPSGNLISAATRLIIIFILAVNTSTGFAQESVRPRIVVTTDPELDDSNSLIRFLLYSTDLRVEGLIYASSGFHWKGDATGKKWYVSGREYTRYGLKICPCESYRWAENEQFIHDAVATYEKVYPNLRIHNHKYPSPDYLKSRIRTGNIEFDGDITKDTPGSDLIKSLMLDNEPGPLYITAWGGQSTIARALKSIQDEYENTPEWSGIKDKIIHKVILLPSGDQDDTYAKYIKPNWPEIDYRQFTGGPSYGYGAQLGANAADSVYMTTAWMQENVSGRGPFGSLYRVWGDGKQMVKGDIFDYFGISGYTNEELMKMGYIVWMPVQQKGSWLGEGDTGTFMDMLANGLRAYEEGSFGGWGGREMTGVPEFNFSGVPADSTASDTTLAGMMMDPAAINTYIKGSGHGPAFPDFFPAAQRDFAARLKWSVTSRYKDANHEPKVGIKGPLNLLASPGEKVVLAGVVTDPDGDAVSLKWWQFRVGTYPMEVTITHPESDKITIVVPEDAKPGQTIHLILEANDNGLPALTRYQRIIITIQ